MSRSRGFSSLFVDLVFYSCQTTPYFPRSVIIIIPSPKPLPHTNSSLSTPDLLVGSLGCLDKVSVTYLGEYGCKRMGIITTILRWSLLLVFGPFRRSRLLLGRCLLGGVEFVGVKTISPLRVLHDLICGLGFLWHRNLGDTHLTLLHPSMCVLHLMACGEAFGFGWRLGFFCSCWLFPLLLFGPFVGLCISC
jgi:hypothetical protein